MTNKEEFDRACELLPPGVLWHDPITVDITLEIASKALLRNVSVPMPATASSVPIVQPMSERERKLQAMLLTVLDQVDYTDGACGLTEMVGAVLPKEVIVLARKALTAYEGEGQ